ncbi:TrmH family RNA methyltransferase [Geojedonia litorea]|uniref:TrmH family RNA methyltransferase n=1 Tax=Geojedonia litorea TaxID=1268269 RepID=A0ABV9N3P3_9FLAO
MQLNYYTSKFRKHQFPITLICDNVTNAPNIGSLFRIADAFGIEKVVFCGEHIPLGRKMTKTSRATENYVNYEVVPSALEIAQTLKSKNYQLIALEITSESQSLHNYQLTSKQPLAIIIGDEIHGVSDELLQLCDTVVHIEMFGNNSSMNVAQATSIALYEFTKQLL